jgi:putative ABC transport system permease protein
MRPRWRKVLADLRSARSRFLMMSVALAASVTVVAAIFTAYAILTREVPRNYIDTHPASAQLHMDDVDSELIRQVRHLPNIADAEASGTLSARIEVGPNQWMPLMLFVVPDFKLLRINAFRSESGAWPPPTGSMLVERSAMPLTDSAVGDSMVVQTRVGGRQSLRISGVVHDAGLAPAWQEQTIYGYVTPATLTALGESGRLDLLKIVVRAGGNDAKRIQETARSVADWLQQNGHEVHEIRIPPPLRHPHQGQLNAVVRMLQIFSMLALLLGTILCATIIGGLLAQQGRQIAIMKAIGARSNQIAGLYLSLVGAIGLVSVLAALPLGLLAGRGFVGVVAELLNLEVASYAVPGWLPIGVVGIGLMAPIATALIPILSASRRTVREAIDDHGVAKEGVGLVPTERLIARIGLYDPSLTLALRNTFRRRARLLMTLGLLATAGAMFIASVNLKTAWEDFVAQAVAYQRYDLELRLQHPVAQQQAVDLIAAISGVAAVEVWNNTSAAVDQGGEVIVQTYPDGGHGGFALRSAPSNTQLVDLHMLEGRWLTADDDAAIVLNQLARSSAFPGVRPGQWISLKVGDRSLRLQVVGIARELLTPSAGYVTAATYAEATGGTDDANAVRIRFADSAGSTVTEAIVAALEREQMGVKTIMTRQRVGAAQAGHIYILVFALVFIAAMMGVVGMLGLASMLSTSVIERTRELGVMRAIGARRIDVLKTVLGEGLIVGMLSWLIAVPLSIPISASVGNVLASISSQPLELNLSPSAAGLWFGLVLVASTVASFLPARRAAQLTVRQTLAVI